MPNALAPSADRKALTAGVICYTLWGFLPLLFNAAERSGATVFEIVAWRTIWSVPLALVPRPRPELRLVPVRGGVLICFPGRPGGEGPGAA